MSDVARALEIARGRMARGGAVHDRKIKRDAFLYIGPEQGGATGQCRSCYLWIESRDRCLIHAADKEIKGGASCGLYIQGSPRRSGEPLGLVTPEQSGLVRRQVRCENCRFAKNGATVCGMYVTLNNEVPELFELDERIEPQGCCNSQLP
jgi:hypothetical protein